jgi:acyl-CoA synthetase (AMP-forming)/AMP-acid ligase II
MRRSCTTEEILWHRWCTNAERHPDRVAIKHWVAGEEPYEWTFAGLIDAAETLAEMLINREIKRGDVCAIIARHNVLLYPLYLACVCVGAIPAILAYPNPRLHPEKFRQGLQGMSQRSGLDWILTERDLEPIVRPLVETTGSTILGLHFPFEWDVVARRSTARVAKLSELHSTIKPSDPLLLQHSSGTTGLQKPVLLSQRAVLDHIKYYGDALGVTEEDKIASWLPLYHDMGLIAAFHLPLALGITTIQIDPFEWVIVPSLLLEAVSKERATISWLPNFAFSMMADKVRDGDLDGLTLDSWRLVISCSEPVRHEDQEKFLARFQSYGLKPEALSACYAMAETTFAVTQNPPGVRPPVTALDRVDLSRGNVRLSTNGASARVCVSSGQMMPGCKIRIVNDTYQDVPDETLGEIAVKSESLFDGYRNYPEKTTEVLRDGWYYTGDYGFKRGPDYYIVGRKKDIVIVAGNNIYPEDVENVVGGVDGVIPGRVIAFGEEDERIGSERLAVIAETDITDAAGRERLRVAIIKAGMSIDVSIASVYLAPARFLVKSSSGKPSRKANKERVDLLRGQDPSDADDQNRRATHGN